MTTRRVATIPNAISAVRLIGVPVFCWLLFSFDDRVPAVILLAVLGASDWVDGWIARRFDQGSELGKIIDPVADRVLLLTSVIALLVDDAVPTWFGVLVLIREITIAVAGLAVAAAGARRIDVQWVGKAGTLLTMFALPAFLLHAEATGTTRDLAEVVAWCFAIPALILSYYAAVKYGPIARAALHEGRAARAAGAGLDSEALPR
jgi:cardiolipin synthase